MWVIVTEGESGYFGPAHASPVQNGDEGSITHAPHVAMPMAPFHEGIQFAWLHVPASGRPRVLYARDFGEVSVRFSTEHAEAPSFFQNAAKRVEVLVDRAGGVALNEYSTQREHFLVTNPGPGEAEGIVLPVAEPGS